MVQLQLASVAIAMLLNVVMGSVDSFPKVSVSDFEEKTKNSPIDHYNYQDHRAYKQRYWVNSKYFNEEDRHAPIFLYICGEYTCSIREDRLYPFMVGASHGALLTALEHRFYGKSQPFDDLSNENLQYLSAEQALSDIAHFLNYLTQGKPYRPVIVVGGSYPGALSAWFRSRYPHLSVGSWSSSGVVYPIQDFWAFDFQIFASTQKSGFNCSSSIQNIMREVFEDENNNLSDSKKNTGACPTMHDGDFAFFFSDIFVESVQYGNRTGLCKLMASIEGKPLDQKLAAIKDHAKIAGVAPGDYDRRAIKNTTITDSSARSWTYQYCTQYGWFQTPSRYSHKQANSTAMRPQLLNLTYWNDLCDELFNTSLKINRSIIEFARHRVHGTNIIFTNGAEDPWRWATNQHLFIPELGQKALMADCEDCGHCAELYTPKDSDPKSLKQVREIVAVQVAHWLRHHREQTVNQVSLEDIVSYRVKNQFESSPQQSDLLTSNFIQF